MAYSHEASIIALYYDWLSLESYVIFCILCTNCIVLEFKYTTLYDIYINYPFYSRIQQDKLATRMDSSFEWTKLPVEFYTYFRV